METDICNSCKAKQLFQSTLSEGAIESSRRSKSVRSPHSPAAVPDFDETNISPLTSNLGDVVVGSGSSSSSSREPIHFPPSPFRIGESHTFAIQMKPPKTISSNFSVINLYESHGVLDSEFESLVKESNEKRIEKFYAEVDVIYKPTDQRCSVVCLYFVQRGFTILPLMMREIH